MPKPVVTVFLWNGRQVLLALRSGEVSTFPGHWAGISGYLEGDHAAAWALQEVREETGLAPAELVLRGVGDPLDVDDPTYGGFQVHPHLFEVAAGTPVRSDWEAARLQWVDVDDVLGRRRQPAVPQLYEAFESVWPPWRDEAARKPNLDLSLAWLRRDRSLGAGSLARAAAREWLKQWRLGGSQIHEEERQGLIGASEALADVRPAMVALANMMSDVKQALLEGGTARDIGHRVEQLIERSQSGERLAAERAAAWIAPGERVMVSSYSSTIRNTLMAARDRVAHVVVCESRPLLEGRSLAAELAQAGLAVTLITDAQAFARMPSVDRVLLGADAVLNRHRVVNKVGSGLLALAARHFGKRVTVVADTLKFARDEALHSTAGEQNPPQEVWENPPHGVNISNEYFEEVPPELIDEMVTEESTLSRDAT